MQLGALSNTELSLAKLQQQKTYYSLNSEKAKSSEIKAMLAHDVGLTIEKFTDISLEPLDLNATFKKQSTQLIGLKNLQVNALQNRLDIRRSLAKYAAAESKIKLEVEKQIPDISLSPGFALSLAITFGH